MIFLYQKIQQVIVYHQFRFPGLYFLNQGQFEDENRPAGSVMTEINGAAESLDDILADGQSEACSGGFGGEIGKKYFVLQLPLYAFPVVLHHHNRIPVVIA